MQRKEIIKVNFTSREADEASNESLASTAYVKCFGADGNLIGTLEVDRKSRLNVQFANAKVVEEREKARREAEEKRVTRATRTHKPSRRTFGAVEDTTSTPTSAPSTTKDAPATA